MSISRWCNQLQLQQLESFTPSTKYIHFSSIRAKLEDFLLTKFLFFSKFRQNLGHFPLRKPSFSGIKLELF
jgi:hypothetical protein